MAAVVTTRQLEANYDKFIAELTQLSRKYGVAIQSVGGVILADNPGVEEEDADVQQLNIQKYVLQDGDIMWQAEFFADEGEEGECLPVLSGEGAQAVFDGDYDEIELRQEWLEENTLHEWDEGEFQLEPPLDTEEGQTAADEWDER